MEDYDPSAGDAGVPDTHGISRPQVGPGYIVHHPQRQEPPRLAERLRNAFYNRLAENGHEPAYHPDAPPVVIRKATMHGNEQYAEYEYSPRSPGGGERNQQMKTMFNGFLLGMAHALGGKDDKVCIDTGKVYFKDQELEERLSALLSDSEPWSMKKSTSTNVNPEILRTRLMKAMSINQDSDAAMLPMHIHNGSGYEAKTSAVETRNGIMRYDYLLAGYLLGASQVASKTAVFATKNVTFQDDKWGVRIHLADKSIKDTLIGLLSGEHSVQQESARKR